MSIFSVQEEREFSVVVNFSDVCNLSCWHCFNRGVKREVVSEERLEKYKRLGVVWVLVVGREPCLYEQQLFEFCKLCKDKGFLVRVDTNGTFPDVVERLLDFQLIDGLAVDVKIPFCGPFGKGDFERFAKILFSVDFPFREAFERVMWYSAVLTETLRMVSGRKDELKSLRLRTVKYPALTREDLIGIKECLRRVGLDKYWRVLPFVECPDKL